MIDEIDDDEEYCDVCGTPLAWEDCHEPGCEAGYYDAYEEDPLWYEPGDLERCPTCNGAGGWLYCPTCRAKAEQEA